MNIRDRQASIWSSVDWVTVVIFLALILLGWFSVSGASYEYGNPNLLDFDTRSGKQFIWMICALVVAFVLLMLDENIYDVFAYLIYGGMIVLLVVTIFIAEDVKGSRSWIQLGQISIQPAEFAKFATALALAKYINRYSFSMGRVKDFMTLLAIILLPVLLIILQSETGSALVYFAFFLVLYREGMTGAVLFSGFCAVLFFIVGIKYNQVFFDGGVTSVGEFSVLAIVLVIVSGMLWVYERKIDLIKTVWGTSLLILGISYVISRYLYTLDLVYVLAFINVSLAVYLLFVAIKDRAKTYLFISVFSIVSVIFLFSIDYVFNNVLENHQRNRIEIVLGMKEDLRGAGYNVNQSKIAIGSGGLMGKGFLNGTQTKLKYVPEQDTDFIFCTVGEEQGFVGSTFVLLLFLALILRLIFLAERQPNVFGRVYGYSVVSIIFFHLFVNIGMVLGITPVIGIPLPFFSYGGSSLWGFTILLFVFLRIDASRVRRL